MMRTMMWAVAVLLAAGGGAGAAEKETPGAPSSPQREEEGAVSIPRLIPPDENIEIPKECREAAARTFKEGFKYHIWAGGTEPVPWRAPSLHVIVPFFYVSHGSPTPFGLSTEVLWIKEDGEGEESICSGQEVASKYSSKGQEAAMPMDLMFPKRGLKGTGIVRISLHELAHGQEAGRDEILGKRISNEIQVPVEFH